MNKLIEIGEAIRLCREQGRNPIFILMNPNIHEIIRKEERWSYVANTLSGNGELFGLPLLFCNVKDFLIVDDRHWYEQKF